MTNEQISKRLDEVFSQYENSQFRDIVNRRWVFCNNEKKTDADLLFVGINPSYIEGKVYVPIYNIEDAVKGYKRHYEAFNQVATELDFKEESWAYMDLFYFRESKQSEINKIFKDKEYGLEFIKEQLQLSFDILQNISPNVIVVCNKQAHEFLGLNRKDNKHIWLGFQFQDTDKKEVKSVTGMDSDFIVPNELKTEWSPKIVLSQSLSARYLSTVKKEEIMETLKENVQYALSL